MVREIQRKESLRENAIETLLGIQQWDQANLRAASVGQTTLLLVPQFSRSSGCGTLSRSWLLVQSDVVFLERLAEGLTNASDGPIQVEARNDRALAGVRQLVLPGEHQEVG